MRVMIPCKPGPSSRLPCDRILFKPIIEIRCEDLRVSKGFLHAKTMVVDGEMATVGTSNFDMRSFRFKLRSECLYL